MGASFLPQHFNLESYVHVLACIKHGDLRCCPLKHLLEVLAANGLTTCEKPTKEFICQHLESGFETLFKPNISSLESSDKTKAFEVDNHSEIVRDLVALNWHGGGTYETLLSECSEWASLEPEAGYLIIPKEPATKTNNLPSSNVSTSTTGNANLSSGASHASTETHLQVSDSNTGQAARKVSDSMDTHLQDVSCRAYMTEKQSCTDKLAVSNKSGLNVAKELRAVKQLSVVCVRSDLDADAGSFFALGNQSSQSMCKYGQDPSVGTRMMSGKKEPDQFKGKMEKKDPTSNSKGFSSLLHSILSNTSTRKDLHSYCSDMKKKQSRSEMLSNADSHKPKATEKSSSSSDPDIQPNNAKEETMLFPRSATSAFCEEEASSGFLELLKENVAALSQSHTDLLTSWQAKSHGSTTSENQQKRRKIDDQTQPPPSETRRMWSMPLHYAMAAGDAEASRIMTEKCLNLRKQAAQLLTKFT